MKSKTNTSTGGACAWQVHAPSEVLLGIPEFVMHAVPHGSNRIWVFAWQMRGRGCCALSYGAFENKKWRENHGKIRHGRANYFLLGAAEVSEMYGFCFCDDCCALRMMRNGIFDADSSPQEGDSDLWWMTEIPMGAIPSKQPTSGLPWMRLPHYHRESNVLTFTQLTEQMEFVTQERSLYMMRITLKTGRTRLLTIKICHAWLQSAI